MSLLDVCRLLNINDWNRTTNKFIIYNTYFYLIISALSSTDSSTTLQTRGEGCFCFTRSGSIVSFRMASLWIRATRCEKRHVEKASCRRLKQKTRFQMWFLFIFCFWMAILPQGSHDQLQWWRSSSSYSCPLGCPSARTSGGSSCMEYGGGRAPTVLWSPEGKLRAQVHKKKTEM